ncbi:MAG: hypothetical protein KF784_11385 [Fimbriimonadaceae bacterium]|nr:hypothetical protein [Fimbriimonadaceae bacterium]
MKLLKSTVVIAILTILVTGCGCSGNPDLNTKNWQEINSEEFTIKIPASWMTRNSADPNIDERLNQAAQLNPGLEEIKSQRDELVRTGAIKLSAHRTDNPDDGYNDGCSVVIEEAETSWTLSGNVEETKQAMRPFLAPGSEFEYSEKDYPAGKFGILKSKIWISTPSGGKVTTAFCMFMALANGKSVTITFAAGEKRKADIEKIADEAMKTFKLNSP